MNVQIALRFSRSYRITLSSFQEIIEDEIKQILTLRNASQNFSTQSSISLLSSLPRITNSSSRISGNSARISSHGSSFIDCIIDTLITTKCNKIFQLTRNLRIEFLGEILTESWKYLNAQPPPHFFDNLNETKIAWRELWDTYRGTEQTHNILFISCGNTWNNET